MYPLFDHIKKAWLSLNRRGLLISILVGVVSSYIIITLYYERKQYQLQLQVANFTMKYARSILAARGPLRVSGEIMYAGDMVLNGSDELVDEITRETGFGCSIFLGDMCISTNASEEGYDTRAIGSKGDKVIIDQVMQEDSGYIGPSSSLGSKWLLSCEPLHDIEGNVVGVISLFKSEKQFREQLLAFKLMLASVLAGLMIILIYFFARLSRKRKILEVKNLRMEKMSEALKWAIRESDKSRIKYKSLFDNTFDLIQEVSMDGKFIYVNNAWKKALGYNEEDMASLDMWKIIHPDYHNHCKRVLTEVVTQGHLAEVDVAFVNKSGDAILLNGNIHKEIDKDGVTTTRGIFRNDTKRKMIHARLKESERQYRLLVESVDDVIFRTDVHGNFIYVNEKAVEVTGFNYRRLLKMNYMDLLDRTDGERVIEYFGSHFRTRARNNYFEFKIRTSGGQSRWIGQNLTTIFANGTDKVILGYMAVARDITQIKEQQEELKVAHDALNLKNREITSSISYAKMIQHSHLPKMDILKGYFPESFLIYEPKDIVSGDFYWFGETENHLVVAMGDCTGHGVPGAFMTMIGLNQLTNIVYDKMISDPAEILQRLDEALINGINKMGNASTESMDGMEMAVCTYHKKTKQLTYSGARRPLFMVSEGTLYRFSPAKRSIGERLFEYNVEFKTQEIEYKKGDMAYLFSDGLKDQFGGNAFKKFSLRKLRELLIENAKLPAEKQYELMRNVFFDWKRGNDQTDDVLLMGFKL